jgi:hypothetical protein
VAERYLEAVPLDDLKLDPRNPKGHDLDLLGSSVTRFGYVEPVVIDERTGKLVAGHGRVIELRALFLDDKPPPEGVDVDADGRWLVPAVRGWRSKNSKEAAAYLVASNRTSEAGGWDNGKLAEMMGGFTAEEFVGVGYSPDDLAALLNVEPPIAFNPNPQGGGNAGGDASAEQKADQYRNSQVRSMVFDYPLADYESVGRLAARARAAFGVESNAELFVKLLEESS